MRAKVTMTAVVAAASGVLLAVPAGAANTVIVSDVSSGYVVNLASLPPQPGASGVGPEMGLTVPKVDCQSGQLTSLSVWAGLGKQHSGELLQTGIQIDCANGNQSTTAYWDVSGGKLAQDQLPIQYFQKPVGLKPGDSLYISPEVDEGEVGFTVLVTNAEGTYLGNDYASYDYGEAYGPAAECIAGRSLPSQTLAAFKIVKFNRCDYDISSADDSYDITNGMGLYLDSSGLPQNIPSTTYKLSVSSTEELVPKVTGSETMSGQPFEVVTRVTS